MLSCVRCSIELAPFVSSGERSIIGSNRRRRGERNNNNIIIRRRRRERK